MDVFVNLAQDKLNLKFTTEELSWLQTLFLVLFDNIYKYDCFTVPCEEICLQILSMVMSANENCIPTSHMVLTVKDLSNFSNNVSFVGSIGNTTSEMVESSENNTGYLPLDKRNVILIGYLTAFPKSRNSLIPRAGLLYLEDKKNTMICQVCKPERFLQDKLVLVPKWNFILCPKFPVLVFEGNTSEAASGSEFGYIEVIEDCVCIGEKWQKSLCHIPKSLSVGDYAKMESKLEKLNLRGCLIALSPIHRSMQNNPKEKSPFFLAQLECDQTQYSTVVVFQGERFSHWHNFLSIGETFVMSNLLKTTMNKGQPSERKVLAATRKSDLFKEQPSTCVQLERVSCAKNGPSAEKRRKWREPSNDDRNTEQVKIPKVETQSCSDRSTISVVTHCSKSETFSCSLPMGYQGVITAIINIEAGVYEVDNRMKLYTHYHPCTNFGFGMRVGALVSLHNVHLCKLDKEVLGFCCCTYSTIEVVKHSGLASPFKALVPSMYYLYHLSQCLTLLQFIRFLELTDLLIKKFRPSLSRNHVVCRKKVLKSPSPPQPTILSHVVNLDSLSSTSSRDIYQEFSGNPHVCLVSRSPRKQTLPNPLTLLDILNAIDRWGAQETVGGSAAEKDEMKKSYGWHHQEITKDEISKDMVLMGWFISCSDTGQLFLCDQTAKIPCLIAETEIPQTIHKCTNSCLQERNTTQPVIVAPSDTKQNHCPMVQPRLCGAILKVESFKIVIESFGREQSSSNTGTSGEKILAKSYLVFSLRHTQVLGTVPGIKTLGISTNQRKVTAEKRTEGLAEDAAERCFVFLVKSKEIKSLDLKENNPSLTSCVHGYLLGEVEKENLDDPNSVSLEAYKKSVIIRFEKDCSALAFLHPGCLYYVTDRCHVDKTSRIQKALNLKAMCPVIEMNSSLRFEQIDKRLLSQDVYEEWSRLSETCRQISSVRESLSKKNQTKEENFSGFKHQEPQLLSFRGVIINRDYVVSNQSDESCPFPTIPSGQMFLPHYGLISRSRALALSLGFCFLGTKQLVLTVRDIETADTVKVYIDLCTYHYPCGLIPGAVVTFLQVSNHTSKRGNIYFSFKACSNIIVESLSFGSSISNKTVPCLPRPPDSNATQFCNLIDFSDRHRNDEVISTVAYVICRITAVQKVILTSKCSKCAKLVNNCYCSFAGAKQTWIFGAQARCLVEDGTGEAMLYVENDQVKELLLTSDTSWNEIKDLSRKQGELSYQRSAFWKNSAAGGETRADRILSSIASSPPVFRRVKVLCRQFRMSYLDNVVKDKEHETRTITVDRNEHSTYIFGKVTLNVLDVKEVDSKEEASRLIKLITKNITPQ